MHRLVLVVLAALQSSRPTSHPADEPRWVEPPGPDTPDVTALLARAEQRLKTTDVSTVLCDPEFLPLHPRPSFRALIRDHATGASVRMVPDGEPGEPLTLDGRVVDAGGAPAAGVLVYAYHTDARGWYAAAAPHVSGNSGDQKHARLFAYLTTDRDGRFALRTIRPAGYPRSDLPQHVHVELFLAGRCVLVTEIRFADDPRLTPALRARSRQDGAVVVPVQRDRTGSRCEATLSLPSARK